MDAQCSGINTKCIEFGSSEYKCTCAPDRYWDSIECSKPVNVD